LRKYVVERGGRGGGGTGYKVRGPCSTPVSYEPGNTHTHSRIEDAVITKKKLYKNVFQIWLNNYFNRKTVKEMYSRVAQWKRAGPVTQVKG